MLRFGSRFFGMLAFLIGSALLLVLFQILLGIPVSFLLFSFLGSSIRSREGTSWPCRRCRLSLSSGISSIWAFVATLILRYSSQAVITRCTYLFYVDMIVRILGLALILLASIRCGAILCLSNPIRQIEIPR